jgi:hypothetical protein
MKIQESGFNVRHKELWREVKYISTNQLLDSANGENLLCEHMSGETI